MKCANSELREAQNPLTRFIDDPRLSMQLNECGGARFIVETTTLSFHPDSRFLSSDSN